MQNLLQALRLCPIMFEKPVILTEKLKTFRASTIIEFNNFCWNFTYVSYLSMSTKRSSGFILLCLDLELFAKINKELVTCSEKPGLSITQDLK